jgi:hypothetical protein
MISEWMKVMLEEISRKKAEAEQARLEDQRRAEDQLRSEGQRRPEKHRSHEERCGQGESVGPRSVSDRAQG